MASEPFEREVERIERSVRGGDADLGSLGFWRLVGRAKARPDIAERWADALGRIDETAFRARVRPLFPVWLGTVILLGGCGVCVALVLVGLLLAEGDPGSALGGLMVMLGGGGLAVAAHGPAHWAAGRAMGMRFVAYFLDGPLLIQPGMKVELGSYLRVSATGRAWMHAAGALATKIAPFAVVGWVLLSGADVPWWSTAGLLAFGFGSIVTDVLWSTRHSDWKRFRRERGFAG